MSEYIKELIKIGYFLGMSLALASILLLLVYLISFTSKVNFEKSSAYECGFQPFSETNYPFQVQFALIAILFLLFDIEILFLYPLYTSIVYFSGLEIIYLICFFIIVTVGLIYEISRGIVKFQEPERNYDHNLKYTMSFLIFVPSDSIYFNYVVFISCIFIFIYLFKKIPSYFLKISVITVLFLTIISKMFPLFSFLCMLSVSSIILVLSFPYQIYEGFFEKQKAIILQILNLLYSLNILDFLATLYVKFFCVPRGVFLIRSFVIASISISYIFVSRWYFHQSVFLHTSFSFFTQIFIFIILFLGISVGYFRFIVNLSLLFTSLTLRYQPNLLSPSILYVFGEGDEKDPLPPSSVKNSNNFSLINISYTRQYYRQYFSTSNPNFYRTTSLCIAISAAVMGGFAAYYSKIQAEQSKIQAEQSKIQSYHTAREADVAAFDAKLITQEEYYRRHPEDKPAIPIKKKDDKN